MAYYKKRGYFAKRRRNRRYGAKSKFAYRGRRKNQRLSSSLKTYNFKRTMATVPFIGGGSARYLQQTAAAQHLAAEFRLDQLPNYSEFTNLYDSYRINKIVCKFIPMIQINNIQPIAAASASNPGLFGSIVDRDDANPLGAYNDYLEYPDFRFQPAITSRTHTRVFVPCIRGASLDAGGGLISSVMKSKQWLDCAIPSIPHYGLKCYLDAQYSVNTPQVYQLQTTIYMSFRGTR